MSIEPSIAKYIVDALIVVGFQVALVFAWRRLTKAEWNILVVSLVAFAVIYLVGIPIKYFFEYYQDLDTGIFQYWRVKFPHWLAPYIVLGLLKEGTKWLVFRRVITEETNVVTSGVMFGLVYSVLLISTVIVVNLNEYGIHNTYPLRTIWEWGIVSTSYNVATSIALMLSVQRKDLRLLAAAFAFNLLYNAKSMGIILYSINGPLAYLREKYEIFTVTKAANSLMIFPIAIFIFLLVRYVERHKIDSTPL